jgi:uncharacterized protein
MKLSDKFTFDAEQEAVWNVLMNPDAIAQALPGVDHLVPIEGEANAWRVTVKLSVASVNGVYSGTIRMTDIEPMTRYVLTVSGEGQQSIIGGVAQINLSYDAEKQKTVINWEADANLSGRLASIGQRLVSAAASMLSRQFFQSIAKQVKAAEQP